MTQPSIGVICGLHDEAATLPQHPDLRVACVAGDGARAYAAACSFAREGARLLISYGTAAGVAPGLPAGALVCADPYHFDDLSGLVIGDIQGVDSALTTPDEKAAFHARTGALAADMETAGVMQAASEYEVSLIRLRAISDDAAMAAPACALAGMRPDGSTAIGPVLKGLMRRPQDLPALLRLARGYGRALSRLRGFRPRFLGLLGDVGGTGGVHPL